MDRLAAAVLLSAGISVTRVRGSNPMLPGGDSDFGDFHHFISWLTDEIEVPQRPGAEREKKHHRLSEG